MTTLSVDCFISAMFATFKSLGQQMLKLALSLWFTTQVSDDASDLVRLYIQMSLGLTNNKEYEMSF
jgi:hypothetical protein